jgi:hypothetical protein
MGRMANTANTGREKMEVSSALKKEASCSSETFALL